MQIGGSEELGLSVLEDRLERQALSMIRAGLMNDQAVQLAESREDEAEDSHSTVSTGAVPQEAQVLNVKVELGPQFGVLLDPRVERMNARSKVQ